jgi:hypothetical protein
MAASVLPPGNWMAQPRKPYGPLWTVAGFVAIWTGLFIYHLSRYRSSGFRDHDWLARHDDSDPGGALYLELGSRSGASPCLGVDLQLWVKSHSKWEVVDDDEVVLMPDKVIRCRFDLNHELFPSGFYDVRWFRPDERGSSLKSPASGSNYGISPVGRRTGLSRINRRLAPKSVAYQRGLDQATQSGRGPLASVRGADGATGYLPTPTPGGLPLGLRAPRR